jgi:hypothetical protein
VGAARKNDAMVPTGLYIEAYNLLVDDQERRLAALTSRVPRIVLAALYVITFVAAAFIGYSSGVDSGRRRLPGYVLSLLLVAVILILQDLDRPNTGFIMVSQTLLVDATNAIESLQSMRLLD